MASNIEKLTLQFYEWERRGRGWHVFDSPVDIEPPFDAFTRTLPPPDFVDDGVRPGLFDLFKSIWGPKKQVALPDAQYPLVPIAYNPQGPLRIFSISLPKGYAVKVEQAEQLLLMLSSCKNQVSFEILGNSVSITVQFVCREPDDIFLSAQLRAYFPECIIQEKDSIRAILSEKKTASIIDLGLRDEFMRPLDTATKFSPDPLIGLIGILDALQGSDEGGIQILFKGAVDPWVGSIIASVTDGEGDSFFLDAPDMPKFAEEKVSSPLFGVTIRAIGQGNSWERAQDIAENLGKSLINISLSEGNALILLSNRGYSEYDHEEDVILRQSHRLGMLLNSQELVNFVHLPSDSVVSAKLGQDILKTKRLPAIAENNPFVLGINAHQGEMRKASVSSEQRLKHTHIIGATGTGKSTLLLNLITQDILQGDGLAVLDPHGDLIENILSRIPEHRMNDVILIDPSDTAFPVGFNILTAHSEIEKEILSSDLVAVFRRFSSSWGDQMNSVLANAILAFLESERGGTLMDLRRFLVEKEFRDEQVRTVTDPHIVYYWQKEYPLLKSTSIGSILTRLDTFLRPKPIRYMVAQKKGLDFEKILDTKKILLIKLSQGLIGDENSYILGTTFVSKIYQAAMARQAKTKETRSNFYLYVDEFQNFITPSMSAILSGARKYHLGLILAHQDMQQLVKNDSELASAVISNAATRICFRIGDTDAKRFGDGFSYFDEKDLQNLGVGEAIVRIERPENDFNLNVKSLANIRDDVAQKRKAEVIVQSQKRNGTPKDEVDALFVFPAAAEKKQELKRDPVIEPEQEVIRPVVKEIVVEQSRPPIVELTEESKRETTEKLTKQKQLSQHRYVQTLVKKMAEVRGYKATIEATTPDGQGRVDVSLEKNGRRIACEIGVTTSKAWEVHNIEKCLAAGYDLVVAIPVDARAGMMMQAEITKSLNAKFHPQVFVMEADALFHYFDSEVAKEASTETRMKGYRVTVEYDAVSDNEMKTKRDMVTRFLVDSAKKKKDNK